MIVFHKILVSLDFSESALSALKVATKLAWSLGAELHLAHVVEYPLQLAVGGPVDSTLELQRDVRKRAEQQLHEAAEVARALGVSATTHLLEGDIVPTVVGLAKDLEINLIVLGRRGVTRLMEVMIGSVTEQTVRLAPCPCLIVREADGAD